MSTPIYAKDKPLQGVGNWAEDELCFLCGKQASGLLHWIAKTPCPIEDVNEHIASCELCWQQVAGVAIGWSWGGGIKWPDNQTGWHPCGCGG